MCEARLAFQRQAQNALQDLSARHILCVFMFSYVILEKVFCVRHHLISLTTAELADVTRRVEQMEIAMGHV